MIEQILGRKIVEQKSGRDRKSTIVDPELNVSTSYHSNSGTTKVLGSKYPLTGVSTIYFTAGIYLNNILKEATSGKIYDFDIGAFLFMQTRTLSSATVEQGNLAQGQLLEVRSIYKNSRLSSQGMALKFRFLGSNSQDFELALSARLEFNLENLSFQNDSDVEEYYLEKYAAYGPGLDFTFYFLPFWGIAGNFSYLFGANLYSGANATASQLLSGTNPTIKKYYIWDANSFLEFGPIRLFGGQFHRQKTMSGHRFHFTELVIDSYYGGLAFFMHF